LQYITGFEVNNIRLGNIFDSLDEVYQYYKNDVLKIVNIKQLLFYASICRVQPDWIDKSIYNGRLIAYYGRERTKDCWERWKRYDTGEENPMIADERKKMEKNDGKN
jgi:hypothetical protein